MAKNETEVASDKRITLTITTPRGVKFVEKADMVIMRGLEGDIGVLPGHESISTVLGDGILRIHNNGNVNKLAVFGGVAEISDKTINILTTIAQSPDEIDLERAESDRQEAEAALQERREENISRRLQIMQIRALVRINVSHSDYFSDDDSEDEES